jgi:sulfur-oxidizing protein SoxA
MGTICVNLTTSWCGHPAGAPDRISTLSAGMAKPRLIAAAAAQLPTGMRAAPYAYGAPEIIELELFLGRRARGLTLETPAVRP